MGSEQFDHLKLDIKPRHMDFPFGALKKLKYFDDNIYKSAFIAGMSTSFPDGEAEFLNSVRNYREQVKNPDLKRQVKGFIGQEGHHSHQHNKVNKELERLGYDTGKIERIMKNLIKKRVTKCSDKFRLAHTVCIEHITGIMAEHALTHPAFFEGMEAPFKDLMLWHAVEELEHKAVAFDVYQACVNDTAYLHKVMKLAIVLLTIRLTRFMLILAFSTGKWRSWREWKGFYAWMFGKGGLWRSLRQPYKTFFHPNFHPWNSGGLGLIEKWENELYRPHQDKRHPDYAVQG
ncbi:metal-dependent hydrolase [Alteromonas sp. D210916BOD_24]|uniref:metal-dependent hydrolase n=1 Tax=Alteromonas sp. D210916BOD_24 TaxID=3157618 RepID=UPI00399CAB39